MKEILTFAWVAAAMAGLIGGCLYSGMRFGDMAAHPDSFAIGLGFMFAGLGALTVAYFLQRKSP